MNNMVRLSAILLLLGIVTRTSLCGTPQGQRARGLNPQKPISVYLRDTWQHEQGLNQVYIQKLYQSSDGFLWIGAQEGLVRFDGSQFIEYNRTNSNLKHNTINDITQSKDGTMWIASGGGLYMVKNGVFTAFQKKDGLPSDNITCVLEDKFGVLWVGTTDGLVYRKNNMFQTYTTNDGLTRDEILSLAQEKTGAIWAGTTGGGLNYIKAGRITGYVVDDQNLGSYTKGDPIAGADIQGLFPAQNGTLWIATNEGLYNLKAGGAIQTFGKEQGLVNEDIRNVLEDREGTIWAASNGGGVFRYIPSRPELPFTNLSTKNGLSADEVFCLAEDFEGAIWIGTSGGGLNRLKDRRFTTLTTKQGLSNNNVLCVTEDQSKTIWFGTNGGGLHSHSPVDGSVTYYTTQNGLFSNIINSLLPEKSGGLWVGSRSGLQLFKNRSVVQSYTGAQGLSNDNVLAMAYGHDSTLWIGASSGLNSLKNGIIKQFNAKQGLPNDNVRVLLVDSKNVVWGGTRGAGIFSYQNGVFKNYTIKDGLGGNYIWSLFEDSNGVLWIGTSGGLSRLQNGAITTITKMKGLFDDVLFSISEDDAGWMWFSSGKGVFRVHKVELEEVLQNKRKFIRCLSYNYSDGLKSTECASGSQPSVWKTSTGHLWFPTNRGLSVVESVSIPYNPIPPPVIIDRVMANENRVGGTSPWLEQHDGTYSETHYFAGDSSDLIRLKPGISKFTFFYSATSLLMPERVKFRYILEGYDNDWVDADTRRQAYYTNLPRGVEYRFRVMACNNDGIWNEVGASYSFYLKPRFYETWWFYALCIVGISSGSYGFFLFRIRAIKKRNEILKKMVDEQTSEIRSQKDLLEEQARDIQMANTELQQKNILILAANDQLQILLDNIESSIRYAKRIQDAMLPYHERIERALSEYFILFKPRDIVSGDFYWFVEHNDVIVLAAADCTGHGIPGAFMSMIGNAMLTQIIVEQNILEPDLILNTLHTGINRA